MIQKSFKSYQKMTQNVQKVVEKVVKTFLNTL